MKKKSSHICTGHALGIAFGITMIVLLLAGGAGAITPTMGTLPAGVWTTVNNSPGGQGDPHIDGDLVSYTSQVIGGSEIRYFNFTTGVDMGIPVYGYDWLSDVSGRTVVFQRFEVAKYSIWSFDTATAGPAVELAPLANSIRRWAAIGATTVAWQDLSFGPGISEIVAYDLTTGSTVRLTEDLLVDKNPSVAPGGNVIVWEKCDTSVSPCNIWKAVKGTTGWTTTQVTNTPDTENLPTTNGNLVVYDANHVGNPTGPDI